MRLEPNSLGTRLEPNSLGTRLEPNSLGIRLEPNSLGTRLEPNSLGTRLEPNSLGMRLEPNSLGTMLEPNSLGTRLEPNSLGIRLDRVHVSHYYIASFWSYLKNFLLTCHCMGQHSPLSHLCTITHTLTPHTITPSLSDRADIWDHLGATHPSATLLRCGCPEGFLPCPQQLCPAWTRYACGMTGWLIISN